MAISSISMLWCCDGRKQYPCASHTVAPILFGISPIPDFALLNMTVSALPSRCQRLSYYDHEEYSPLNKSSQGERYSTLEQSSKGEELPCTNENVRYKQRVQIANLIELVTFRSLRCCWFCHRRCLRSLWDCSQSQNRPWEPL